MLILDGHIRCTILAGNLDKALTDLTVEYCDEGTAIRELVLPWRLCGEQELLIDGRRQLLRFPPQYQFA